MNIWKSGGNVRSVPSEPASSIYLLTKFINFQIIMKCNRKNKAQFKIVIQ